MIAIGNIYFVVINVNKRKKSRWHSSQFEAIIENGLNHVYQVKRQIFSLNFVTIPTVVRTEGRKGRRMKRLMDECLEIPACPTGHWPFGAAAQKGITGMISAAAAA